MEPQVDVFTRKRKEKDIDVEPENKISKNRNQKKVDFDIDIVKEKRSKRTKQRLSGDLIVFILSIVLMFFVGTLSNLTVLISFDSILSLVITVTLLLILRIIMIKIDNIDD